MATPDTLTIICAYDNAEAETVRRDLGLRANQVIEAADADRFAGIHGGWDLRIVETPRFLQRPDAGAIRQALHVASRGCNVERVPHDGEGQPAPHLRGGTRSRLGHVAARDASGEWPITREKLQELLDSKEPGDEIAAVVREHMHLGFGDHPVVQEIIRRRYEALKAYLGPDEGEAAEQTISEEDAHALVAHLKAVAERLAERPHLTTQLPPIPDQVVPGQYLATVYGVRVIVANPAPVIAEQHGNPGGHATYATLVQRSAPAGTQPQAVAHYLIPNLADDKPMRQHAGKLARRHVAEMLGEPHVLIHLRRGDLPTGQWPLPDDLGAGMVLLVGVTVRAIPGALPQIVLRPGPGLPPGWLRGDEGKWQARPPFQHEMQIVPPPRVILDLESSTWSAPQYGRARPTGRVEVNASGDLAEVWEVSL
ncbi:hypothetical protein ABZ897_15895 [Nonomuraea sp. NPDC046802]|uniref:hypothetical protein n=1 Tax=Nonomuraea sp. NPDC046802 TaxID=3154919 RepID=UPI0033E653EB